MTQQARATPDTLVHQAYQREVVTEEFRCNYGLNPKYRMTVSNAGPRIAGIDVEGVVRIAELSDHRFFIAALFLPQLSSSTETPHPLITAYLEAALVFRALQKRRVHVVRSA
jgi:CTP synthase (UTP-ammonia lyase)